MACPGLLSAVCQLVGGVAGSVGSSVAGSAAGDVLSSISSWVVQGASWLLGQVGSLLNTTTSVDLGAKWFTEHYGVMGALAGVVLLPMLLLSVVQALYRQSASTLLRTALVQLPLAILLMVVAIQLVQLALSLTDALSSAVASGSGGDIDHALSGVANAFASQAAGGPQGPGAVPAFVLLLGALLVALGGFTLWIELLVRAAAVYVAVLFLPLALASLVWPAIAHWCRRLVDTLAALVLSKFVIVAVLSLGASALAAGTGSGFASVLGGGALLLLATFMPFTLLRLIPAIEAGAVHHLEGARQRATSAAVTVPRSAAAFALWAQRQASFDPGQPGTGRVHRFEAPGTGTDGALRAPTGPPAGPGSTEGEPGQDLGAWESNPEADAAYESIMAGRGPLTEQELAAAAMSAPRARPAPDAEPVPAGASAGVSASAAGAAGSSAVAPPRPGHGPAGRGQLVLVQDRIGPRIRWIPAGATWADELLGPQSGGQGADPAGEVGGTGPGTADGD